MGTEAVTPEPTDVEEGLYGGATWTWEVDPFEVTATTGEGLIRDRAVTIDGRATGPSTARALAAVLLAAADRVDGRS